MGGRCRFYVYGRGDFLKIRKMETAKMWKMLRALGAVHTSDERASLGDTNLREEKGTRTQTFGPDIFRWGGGLPREGVGAKKFGMSLESREIKLFGRDIPQVPKKHINIKKWGPKLDLRPHPQDHLRPPPRNSLCTVFCWENRHLHKEFGRPKPAP